MALTLSLTNTLGQVVETRVVTGTSLEMDLNQIPPGIYFLQGQTPQGIFSQKIVKQD